MGDATAGGHLITNITSDIDLRIAAYEEAARETGAPVRIGPSDNRPGNGPHIKALWSDQPKPDLTAFWACVRDILEREAEKAAEGGGSSKQ